MTDRLAQLVGLLGLAIVVFATFAPINLRPRTGFVGLERAAAFGLIAFCFVLGFQQQTVWVVLGLVGSACGLELAQALTPDRHPGVLDAAQKVAGVLIGAAAAYCVTRLFRSQVFEVAVRRD